jgi:hypothetical protein
MNIFFKRLFCRHEFAFYRKIYGDEVNMVGGKRTWQECRKCGKMRAI